MNTTNENETLKIYIDECHNDKLSSKLEKMTFQIKKLTKENDALKAKVNNLENLVEKLCIYLNMPSNFGRPYEEKNPSEINKYEEVEETWLFWIKTGLSMDKIKKKLNFTSKDSFCIEVKVDDWTEEKNVYHSLLKNFTKFKDFSDDWSTMNNKQLKHFLQSILSSTMVSDTLILLRNLPNEKNKKYDEIVSNIAMLAGVMFNTWEELETKNEMIGRMALVLDSEEKLEILNIVKDDARMILLVEPLFEESEM
jgi:hypothetical protein